MPAHLCGLFSIGVWFVPLSARDALGSAWLLTACSVQGAYGVVTMPFGVREGINIFLDGFVPTENLRFRETSLSFKVSENLDEGEVKRLAHYEYPELVLDRGPFQLTVRGGNFSDSQIIVLLGENGTGKTTMIRMLTGGLKPTNGAEVPELNVR
jgi:ATP-binding cassette subfamily E protein 1